MATLNATFLSPGCLYHVNYNAECGGLIGENATSTASFCTGWKYSQMTLLRDFLHNIPFSVPAATIGDVNWLSHSNSSLTVDSDMQMAVGGSHRFLVYLTTSMETVTAQTSFQANTPSAITMGKGASICVK